MSVAGSLKKWNDHIPSADLVLAHDVESVGKELPEQADRHEGLRTRPSEVRQPHTAHFDDLDCRYFDHKHAHTQPLFSSFCEPIGGKLAREKYGAQPYSPHWVFLAKIKSVALLAAGKVTPFWRVLFTNLRAAGIESLRIRSPFLPALDVHNMCCCLRSARGPK